MNDPIERIAAPSREEFEKNYLNKNKPVILTDVTPKWGAFSKWEPEYFKSVAGDAEVTVHYHEEASFFDWYVDRPNRVDLRMKFADFVDILQDEEKGKQYYMTEHNINLISDEMVRDVEFGAWFDADKQPADYTPMIFIGRDTCMPLHYHGKMEAFLCQFRGTKRIILFAPDQYDNLYAGEWYKPVPLFSRIDGRKILDGTVDLQRFPKYAKAKPMDFMLRPGEMLFIPVHWWHVTGVNGYQVSSTHFFRSKLSRWTFPTPGLQNLGREVLDAVRNGVTGAKTLVGLGPQQRSQEA